MVQSQRYARLVLPGISFTRRFKAPQNNGIKRRTSNPSSHPFLNSCHSFHFSHWVKPFDISTAKTMIQYAGVFLLYLLPAVNSFVCYYPNGHSEQSLVYQPCPNTNGGTGMCCATNRTNPSGGSLSAGLTADMCLENGLCINTHTNDDGTVSSDYWRDQCTVSDWSSGRCLDVCTSGTVCHRKILPFTFHGYGIDFGYGALS